MKRIIGSDAIRENYPEILYDESRFSSGIPAQICFPENSNDIRAILLESSAQNRAITVIGAQTGITGSGVPVDGCTAVCFNAMNRIQNISWPRSDRPVLTCDPGITLADINKFLSGPGVWPYPVPGSERLKPADFFYPPDPTELTAQLGGTVATNASGARSFRFGPTRNHIHALSLVLASGETVTIHRGEIVEKSGYFTLRSDQGSNLRIPMMSFRSLDLKNASGYHAASGMDILDLLIGSEGTLAVFSSISIILCKRPEYIGGLSFFPSRESAFDFADAIRGELQVAAIEYFDETGLALMTNNRDRISVALPEFPTGMTCAMYWEFLNNSPVNFEERMDHWEHELNRCGSSFDHTWSGFEPAEIERLKAFRHALPELINSLIAHYKTQTPAIRKIGTDTALPSPVFRSVFAGYLDSIREAGLQCAAFGHLGDYHIHVNILPQTDAEMKRAVKVYREIMQVTVQTKGTVSAEHGIGKIKLDYLAQMYGSDAIDQMKLVKAAFDPQWILNPGNLFEPPQSAADQKADHSATGIH